MSRQAGRRSSLWQCLDPYNWCSFGQSHSLPLERCVLCLDPVEGRPLCVGCARDLPWRTTALHGRRFRGVECAAAFRYEFPISRLIWSLKFANNVGVGQLLGELMAESPLASRFAGFTVCAVPLSFRRQWYRSYNQSAVLARALASRGNLALDLGVLHRRRHTPPQRGLGARHRRENVRGAFAAAPVARDQRLLLVDDVITTGATLLAARHALLQAGAIEVVLFACAAVTPA